MKKWIALILGVVMVLGVTACGDGQNGSDESLSRNESQSNETKTLGMEESSQQGSESNSETIVEVQEEGAETSTEMPEISGGGGKTLVVYYSASVNTKEVADYIASAMEGDLFELVPTEIYT